MMGEQVDNDEPVLTTTSAHQMQQLQEPLRVSSKT